MNSGADPLLIADRLGHEKVTTTLGTYSHLYPDKGQHLADDLDAIKNRHDQEKAGGDPPAPPKYDDPPTPEPDF